VKPTDTHPIYFLFPKPQKDIAMLFMTTKKPARPEDAFSAAIDQAVADARKAGVSLRTIADEFERRSDRARLDFAMTAPVDQALR
jgi:hypothetical protein